MTKQKAINLNLSQALELARSYYVQGKHGNAQTLCRKIIALRPDHAGALNMLAMIAYGQRNFPHALEFVDRSISADPNWDQSHSIKGLILKQQGELNLAYKSHIRALELNPENSEIHNNLAAVLQEMDCMDQAQTYCKQAIALSPGSPGPYFNYGNGLMIADRFEEAVPYFEQAIALDKTFLKARHCISQAFLALGKTKDALKHIEETLAIFPEDVNSIYSLSGLKKFKKGDPEFIALDHVLEKDDLSLPEKIRAHFCLGKMHADTKEYGKSFHHYQAGNRLRINTGKGYDPEKYSSYISVLIKECSYRFFKQLECCGLDTRTPVFIIGMPRSGTTLVEQIISSHPKVYGAGELPFLGDCLESFCGRNPLQKDFVHTLKTIDKASIQKAANQYLDSLPDTSPGIRRVTDKMPANLNYLWLGALMFPRATVIHCKRDPMDTMLSCFTQNFTNGQEFSNDLDWLAGYYKDYLLLMDHWYRVLPINILTVEYESLVKDIEGVSKKIFDHCGLAWDSQCLDFYKQARVVKTASVLQVRRPVYTSSIGRWKAYETWLAPIREKWGL